MLTVQKARRVEVWSAPQCAGGLRRAVLTNVQRATASVQLAAEGTLTVVLPSLEPGVAQLAVHRVLRTDESDTSFDEWRITDVQKDGDRGLTTIVCAPCYTFLGRRALVQRLDGIGGRLHSFDVVGMAPSAIIDTYVLPALSGAGITWVARGAIANDAPIDLTISWASPWAVLRQIEAATSLELELVRTGTTGYTITLVTAIASAAAVADVRFGKNLLQSGLQQSTDAQATRIFPKGAATEGSAATMARAQWSVVSVVGSVVTLADPAGNDGPIAFDNQLVGLYLRTKAGALRQVTASSAAGQSVTLASVAGIANADLVQFRADAAGSDLTWLDSPADVARDGILAGTIDQPDVPSTNNLLPNPVGRTWPAGTLPSGWTNVGGGTPSKQTAAPYLRTAGASIHYVATADGQGVLTPAGALSPSAAAPYGSAYADLWVVSGSVRVEMVLTTAGGTVVVPLAPAYATNSVRGQWESLGVSGIDVQALGATAVALRVVAHQGAAEFYVDAAQHTETAAQQPLLEGSGGTKLWQAANERLRLYGGPPSAYQLSIADLTRLGVADAAFLLGGRVRITDPRVVTGSFSTRVVGLERELVASVLTGLTLSTRPDDLQGALARPAKAPRQPVSAVSDYPGGETAPSLVADPVYSATLVTVNYTSNCTSLWYTLDNGAAVAMPASGFTVGRNAAGAGSRNLTLHGLLNGQEIAVPISILAQDTAPPTAYILELTTARSRTQATLQLRGTVGAGSAAPLSWRYTLDSGTPSAWFTTSITANNLVVTRAQLYDVVVTLDVQQPDGQATSYTYTVAGVYSSLDETTGRVKRGVPLDDGDYGGRATTSDGLRQHSGVTDSTTREVRRAFAKSSYTDGDNFDYVPEGASYNRVLASAVTSGQVDFSKSGVVNRHAGNLQRSGGDTTQVFTILQNVANTGHLASTMQDATTREVRRAFAKSSYTDSDSLDFVPEGTTYNRPLASYLSAGRVTTLYRATGTDTVNADALAGAIGVASDSVLVNGGGQDGALGSQAAGWSFGAGYALVPATDWAKIGSRSLKLDNPTGADSWSYQDFNVALGDVWELAGWIRVSAGISGTQAVLNLDGIGLGLTVLTAEAPYVNGTDVGVAFTGSAQAEQYVRMLFKVTTAGVARIKLQNGYSGNNVGTAWFDGVTFSRMSAPVAEGGQRGYTAIDSYNGAYARLLPATTDSTLREARRAFAKSSYTDGDSVDYIPDGSSYKRVLGVNSSNQITPTSSSGRSRCKVVKSTAASIPDSTDTVLSFDVEAYDTANMHSPTNNPSRITIPTGGNVGVWLLVAEVGWGGSTVGNAGIRQMYILKNSSFTIGSVQAVANTPDPAAYGNNFQVVAFDDSPSVGDYYEVFVKQTSGASRTAAGIFSATHLW